jgi:hypothetical protein
VPQWLRKKRMRLISRPQEAGAMMVLRHEWFRDAVMDKSVFPRRVVLRRDGCWKIRWRFIPTFTAPVRATTRTIFPLEQQARQAGGGQCSMRRPQNRAVQLSFFSVNMIRPKPSEGGDAPDFSSRCFGEYPGSWILCRFLRNCRGNVVSRSP